jgi:hypothetical protein
MSEPNIAPAAPAVPVASAPTPALPPVIAEPAYLRLPRDQQDQYANVRSDDRSQPAQWRLRSDLPSEQQPPAPQSTPPAEPQAKTVEQPQPAQTPGLGQPSDKPALSPDSYRVELPADLQLPQGFKFAVDQNDPVLSDFRRVAAEEGLNQAQFSRLLGVEALRQAKTVEMYESARQAELSKLGVNGTARVGAVQNWLNAMLGETAGRHVGLSLVNAESVKGFEALVSKFSARNIGPFAPRPVEPDNRVDEQTYNGMTMAERYAYSRGFDQSRFR